VAECFADGEPQDAEDRANARRLVACWNATLPYETEWLEQNSFDKFSLIDRDHYAELIVASRQRDELIEALRELRGVDAATCPTTEARTAARLKADALLAKHSPKVPA
jgi:hypothetical protein